ncbi:TPA_asm: hypothetical protein [Rhyncholacis penicillata amalgavirus 1]|nr:TPA_asm: hypothetical protein [Rhyncholacis penicillata amalgavirus 1]
MASGSNRPLHNIRPDTLAPLREKIQRATALMVSIGFNAAVLTEREMHLLNITTDYYAKLLAPFLSATTVEKASALSAIGVRVGHFTSTATATTHQVVTFLMFLKSEPGMAAIAEMEQRMKLEKKTSTGVSVTEIAALHMGEFQLNEWKNDVANRRQEIEEKIAHYRHEISLLQEESARIAKEGFEHFVPMSVMPPPSALWIEDQCWAHVVRRYNAINVAVPPKDHETLKDSQDMFGERARKEYIIQYLSDEGRMAQLCQYIQSRVGDFRAGGQQRLRRRFANFLATVGYPETPQITAQGQGGGYETGPHQRDPPRRRKTVFDTLGGADPLYEPTEEEGGSGFESEASASESARDEADTGAEGGSKPKVKRSLRSRKH